MVELWLHDFRNGESRALPGTLGAAMPFWSPDAATIGFFAAGRLKTISLEIGTATDVAEAVSARGAAINRSGDLVFAPTANGGLMRRDASGSIAPLTKLDNGDTAHTWPAFLADGRHLIFHAASSQSSRAGIWLLALDDPSARRRILSADAQAVAVDGPALLVLNGSALMRQPLDAATLEPSGRSTVVGLNVGRGPLGQTFASAARDLLIYGAPGSSKRELRWVGRDGQPAGATSEPIDAWDVRLSPDGRRIAVTEIDPQLRTLDVFIRTGAQPAPLRLSLSTDVDEGSVWSPDGLRMAWASQRRKVMVRGAGAVLPEQTIASFDTPVQVWDWSRDGRTLVIGRRHADTGDDLWLQPPVEGAAAQPYTTAPFDQAYAALSPDGRSIAYASNESGQFDIYVDAFPKPGARVRVTTAGGTEPRWAASGRELIFRRGSQLHAAQLEAGNQVTALTQLFDAGGTIRSFDVSRDGRFLINAPASASTVPPPTLVLNWFPQPRPADAETPSKRH